MINVGASVKIKKSVVYSKKVVFGMLLHSVVKMVTMWQVLLTIQWLRAVKL